MSLAALSPRRQMPIRKPKKNKILSAKLMPASLSIERKCEVCRETFVVRAHGQVFCNLYCFARTHHRRIAHETKRRYMAART